MIEISRQLKMIGAVAARLVYNATNSITEREEQLKERKNEFCFTPN